MSSSSTDDFFPCDSTTAQQAHWSVPLTRPVILYNYARSSLPRCLHVKGSNTNNIPTKDPIGRSALFRGEGALREAADLDSFVSSGAQVASKCRTLVAIRLPEIRPDPRGRVQKSDMCTPVASE